MTRELLTTGIRAAFDLAGQDIRGLDKLPMDDLRYLAERCREWIGEASAAGVLGAVGRVEAATGSERHLPSKQINAGSSPARLSILPALDALDLIDAYHRGETDFVPTWERLGALGVSSAVMQSFFVEAVEEARR